MEAKAEYWAGQVAAAKKESISSSEYARRQGISVVALYYWQRKFKAAEQHPTGKFIALRVSADRASSCTLVLPTGLQLEMSALPAPEWLAALGRAVQESR
jgi:hypothetical protein